jgi:hypothetical protein
LFSEDSQDGKKISRKDAKAAKKIFKPGVLKTNNLPFFASFASLREKFLSFRI